MAQTFTREQLIAINEMLAITVLLDEIEKENHGMCRGAQSIVDIVGIAVAKRIIWVADGRVGPEPASAALVHEFLSNCLDSGVTDRIEAIVPGKRKTARPKATIGHRIRRTH